MAEYRTRLYPSEALIDPPEMRLIFTSYFVHHLLRRRHHGVRCLLHVMMRVYDHLAATRGRPRQTGLQLMNPDFMIVCGLFFQTWRGPVSARRQHHQRAISHPSGIPGGVIEFRVSGAEGGN